MTDKTKAIDKAILGILEQARQAQPPLAEQLADRQKRQIEALKEREARRRDAYSQAFWTCPYCQSVNEPTERRLSDTHVVFTVNDVCDCEGFWAVAAETERKQQEAIAASHLARLTSEPLWAAFNTEWPTMDNCQKPIEARQELRHAHQMVRDWYTGKLGSLGIVLAGAYGCGKSHLLRAAYRAYGVQGLRVAFATEPEMVGWITDKQTSEDNHIRRLQSADVLVLDDVGAEKFNGSSEWLKYRMQSIYFQVLDTRAKGERKTLVTTNLRFKEIGEHIGARALSRLEQIIKTQDNWVGLWNVPDYRAKDWSGK